ncbi:MAG: hypothetical protein V1781_09560 [Bacteroidota bacterium]
MHKNFTHFSSLSTTLQSKQIQDTRRHGKFNDAQIPDEQVILNILNFSKALKSYKSKHLGQIEIVLN